MVHLIENNEELKKEKKITIKMPDINGKFGLSFNFGKKEFFIGVAVANIEIETIVRKRKKKVMVKEGTGMFVELP